MKSDIRPLIMGIGWEIGGFEGAAMEMGRAGFLCCRSCCGMVLVMLLVGARRIWRYVPGEISDIVCDLL